MPAPVTLELEWRGKRFRDIDRGLRAVADDTDEAFNAKFKPIARKVLRDYMRGVVGSVRDRVSKPYPEGTSRRGRFPGTLSKRSGRLASQFTDANIDVEDGATGPTVSFTLSGIAAVHERGAVIRAKRAQYLTIPLPAALNKNGTPKRPTARSWRNTFIKRSKKGNLLIFQKQPNGDILPLYVLKKSVRIPKRLAFQEAFEAGLDLVADVLAQELIREFNRA
jgi:hypothetical protein